MKGQPPAPPDSNVGGDQEFHGKKWVTDLSHGKKRVADDMTNADDEYDDGDGGNDGDGDDDKNDNMDDETPQNWGRGRPRHQRNHRLSSIPHHIFIRNSICRQMRQVTLLTFQRFLRWKGLYGSEPVM